EEAPGNPPGGIGLLQVIHGQGQKVDALARIFRDDRRDQDRALPISNQNGATRLLRQAARFEAEVTTSNFHLNYFGHSLQLSLLFSQPPLLNQGPVTFDILSFQVVLESPSLAH